MSDDGDTKFKRHPSAAVRRGAAVDACVLLDEAHGTLRAVSYHLRAVVGDASCASKAATLAYEAKALADTIRDLLRETSSLDVDAEEDYDNG